jgi:hypothetical protein
MTEVTGNELLELLDVAVAGGNPLGDVFAFADLVDEQELIKDALAA